MSNSEILDIGLTNMFLLLLLLSSGEAIHDDVSTSILSQPQSYPSCFTEGTTWSTDEAIDIVEETPSLYSCQDLCFQSPTCQQLTWYDAQASSLALTCFLYSSATAEFPCTNCVSGPQSCTCDVLEPQDHGDWFCPPSSDPSTCHLECHPGYVSDKGTVITCQHGEWSSAPSCVVAVALIAGNFKSPNNQVEVYSKGLHKSLPDLPIGQDGWRRSHTLDLVDSSVLLCGGKATRTSCITLTPSLKWVDHSTTKSERWDHCSVSALGQLHLMGGRSPNGWYYDTTEYLTRSSTTWRKGWKLLEITAGACTAKVEPEVAIMTGGGYSHESSVISYNVTSGAATRLQDLIFPRTSHGCSYVRDEGFRGVLVAGGGVNGGGGWDLSQIYDINTGEWAKTGALTTDRHQGSRMFVIGDQILSSGGMSGLFPDESVDRFNLTSRTWAPAERMLEGKWFHAVTAVPPSMVGIGSH